MNVASSNLVSRSKKTASTFVLAVFLSADVKEELLKVIYMQVFGVLVQVFKNYLILFWNVDIIIVLSLY